MRDAIAEYLNERETARDARTKLKHLIADAALAETPLAALTVADLVQWRTGLLDKMAEASARRVANDARACLNFAAKRHRDKLPPSMRDTVRDGFAVSRKVKLENTREKQILTDADIRRLIEEDTEALIAKSVAEHPDYPLNDRAKLTRELDATRRKHLAFDLQEHGAGISAVGVAVLDAFGRPVAVSIPAPTDRFNAQRDALAQALLAFREKLRSIVGDKPKA